MDWTDGMAWLWANGGTSAWTMVAPICECFTKKARTGWAMGNGVLASAGKIEETIDRAEMTEEKPKKSRRNGSKAFFFLNC
jgi:hypothetical protein